MRSAKTSLKRTQAIHILGSKYKVLDSNVLYALLAMDGYYWNSITSEWVQKKSFKNDDEDLIRCRFKIKTSLLNRVKEHIKVQKIYLKDFICDAIEEKLNRSQEESGDNEFMIEIKNIKELLRDTPNSLTQEQSSSKNAKE